MSKLASGKRIGVDYMLTINLEGASWSKGAAYAKALGKRENMVSLRDSRPGNLE